jgi:hypothetical protein
MAFAHLHVHSQFSVLNGVPAPKKLVAKAAELHTELSKLRAHVEKNFEHVGDRFAEEARKIHYGETKHRDIYGEASAEEAEALAEEGVEIARIPWVRGSDA